MLRLPLADESRARSASYLLYSGSCRAVLHEMWEDRATVAVSAIELRVEPPNGTVSRIADQVSASPSIDMWRSVRKSATGLHVAYGPAYTNNLFAYDTRTNNDSGPELFVDLTPNLRGRNRSTNSYHDARELADGGLDRLRLVQFIDDEVAQRILTWLSVDRKWRLSIELGGRRSFLVRPECRPGGSGLLLEVIAGSDSRSPDDV